MSLKNSIVLAFALAASIAIPSHAENNIDKTVGSYSCQETNFVAIKRLKFFRDKEGTWKISGALVGFPDEVSIGETTPEFYAERSSRQYPDAIVAIFSASRFKPTIVITPADFVADGHYQFMNYNCYMQDADGTKVHVSGRLQRQP